MDDRYREELATLEEAEARVSAERRRLHQQIDSGFASESARAREREVSDERRRLHQRIDELRKLLDVTTDTVVASQADWMGRGFSPLEKNYVIGTRDDTDERGRPAEERGPKDH